MLGHLLELLFFVLADVLSHAFGKSVHEKRPVSSAEQNDCSIIMGVMKFSVLWGGEFLNRPQTDFFDIDEIFHISCVKLEITVY